MSNKIHISGWFTHDVFYLKYTIYIITTKYTLNSAIKLLNNIIWKKKVKNY